MSICDENDMISLFDRGLELAAFGMGTVFVFLTLLVAATVISTTCPLPSTQAKTFHKTLLLAVQ